MRWPFGKRERREAGGFGDIVTRALLQRAGGEGGVTTPAATAALETAAGVYARAFAVADVGPATAATAALTPAILACLAREVVRRGEAVLVIDVGDGVRLTPAGSWNIEGGPDPASWWYRCDLWGPSGNRTVRVPAAGVVHARYSVDPSRPWAGVGPLGWAELTGRLAGAVEDALADEAGGQRGHVLPMPLGPTGETDDEGNEVDTTAALRADLGVMKGRTVLVETTAAGFGDGRDAAPKHDWRPMRIGAAPPAPLVDLRSAAAQAVLSACGVPPSLFATGGDSAGAREAWRLLLHGGVQPLADLLAAELAVKLDEPGLRLSFDGLFASDLQGRARALASMVKAEVPLPEARRLAGLE